ncbi:MAG TPA: hypothetical protein VNY36_05745, partial [Bacteroidia bacterium]|nr:hypothetical protein [Bacteroidia bacterium]
ILMLGVLAGYAFYHGTYYIAEEDEEIYYNSARIFHETGSVRASECTEENISKIWGCNWYGPTYNVFYGLIAKVFGFHAYNFLIINIICLLLIALLIYRAEFNNETKMLIACMFLSLYAFAAYTFTFYPETIQLLFATILTLLLKNIYDKKEKGEQTTRLVAGFILLLLFFSLFRLTFSFWAFGLLAFTNTTKSFIKTFLIGVACFLFAYLYFQYFNAATPTKSLHMASEGLGLSKLVLLAKGFFKNIFNFFTKNPFYELLNTLIFAMALYMLYLNKNRLLLAACIISFVYFAILLTLYTPFYFFFDKQTACLAPLLIIALCYVGGKNIKKATLFLLLFFAPIAYLKAYNQVKQRKIASIENDQLKPFSAKLEPVASKIEGGGPKMVLLLYREFDSTIPLTDFMTNLPVATADKSPITYTVNILSTKYPDPVGKYEGKFRTYGRQYVNYFLSKHPLSIDSTTLVYSNDLFFLYKNNKKTK